MKIKCEEDISTKIEEKMEASDRWSFSFEEKHTYHEQYSSVVWQNNSHIIKFECFEEKCYLDIGKNHFLKEFYNTRHNLRLEQEAFFHNFENLKTLMVHDNLSCDDYNYEVVTKMAPVKLSNGKFLTTYYIKRVKQNTQYDFSQVNSVFSRMVGEFKEELEGKAKEKEKLIKRYNLILISVGILAASASALIAKFVL